MMFKCVVKYLGFLKYIPFTGIVVDGWMMIWSIAFNRKIVLAIQEVEDEISTWNGITCSLHKFGGLQFNYRGKEIGHIHSNGVLDILFDRKTKNLLILQGRVEEHHSFSQSGWTTFYISNESDIRKVIALLKESYERMVCRLSAITENYENNKIDRMLDP